MNNGPQGTAKQSLLIGNSGSPGFQGSINCIGPQGTVNHSMFFIGNSGSPGFQGSIDYKEMEIRFIEKFAWFPKKINEKWIWLSTYYIKQGSRQIPFAFWRFEWVNLEYLTQNKYLEWRIVNE